MLNSPEVFLGVEGGEAEEVYLGDLCTQLHEKLHGRKFRTEMFKFEAEGVVKKGDEVVGGYLTEKFSAWDGSLRMNWMRADGEKRAATIRPKGLKTFVRQGKVETEDGETAFIEVHWRDERGRGDYARRFSWRDDE